MATLAAGGAPLCPLLPLLPFISRPFLPSLCVPGYGHILLRAAFDLLVCHHASSLSVCLDVVVVVVVACCCMPHAFLPRHNIVYVVVVVVSMCNIFIIIILCCRQPSGDFTLPQSLLLLLLLALFFFDLLLLLLSYLCIIEFCLKSDRQPLPLLPAQQQLLPLSHNYDWAPRRIFAVYIPRPGNVYAI